MECKGDDIMEEVTNEVLGNKIDNLKDFITERNNKQDIIIEQNRVQGNKNTVAIASIKGMAIGVSAIVTLAINTVIAFFTFKGGSS